MRQGPRLDAVFHALSDPTRRDMLALLAKRPRSASELGEPFHISQPAVSKHIGTLERAGLVKRTIEGRVHQLRLMPAPLRQAETWMARHRQFWESALESLARTLAEAAKDGRS
jgi:DNA-binding transcriptional ArsR family regulator